MDTGELTDMARERVQTRADADTVAEIEKYQEEKNISESEAVRRLLRAGLDVKGYDGGEVAVADTALSVRNALLLGIVLLLTASLITELGVI